jgi:hypothetical protein
MLAFDDQFDEKVQDTNTLYRQAPDLAEQRAQVVCINELTWVQAVERTQPGLPLRPGQVERQEFE